MPLVRACTRASVLRVTLSLLAGSLLLAGCRVPGSSSASGGSGASQTITVAIVPGVDNAPLRVAVQEGIFRQHGLNVAIKTESSVRAAISALTSGQAQVAGGDYTGFFYFQYQQGQLAKNAKRAGLRLIANGYDAAQNMLQILTLHGSGITEPGQLTNQTIATPPASVSYQSKITGNVPYNVETLAAQSVLEADGVSPTSVNWKPMPGPEMITALKDGQVQAILAPEPYAFQAEESLGAQVLVDAGSGVTSGLPLSGYFSLASEGTTTALNEFQAGLLQAQSDSDMNGPVQAVLPTYAGMTTQDADLITLGSYPTSLSVGEVQRVVQLMFQTGMIANTISVQSMLYG